MFKRKKKTENLSEEQKQWNMMWELWARGEIKSPYNELMTYQGEVNNGGHAQFFFNTENNGDLNDYFIALNKILPPVLVENLKTAYQAHLILEQNEYDADAEDVLNECDKIFFENEKKINCILEKFCRDLIHN